MIKWLIFFLVTCANLFEGKEFPQKELNIVLKKYKVPQENWSGIHRALLSLSETIDQRVERKTALFERNPFNPPREELVIGRLYREAYIEIFLTVLQEYGIESRQQIYEMYNELQGEKADAIFRCYRRV